MKRRTLEVPGIAVPPFNAAPGVVAGDWVFVGGTMATDWSSGLEESSRLAPDFPYNSYGMQLQTHAVFGQINDLLDVAGTSLQNMVRIDQFATDWDEFRHYFPARDVHLVEDRPASTAIAVRSLLVPDAKLIVDGIAVIPRHGVHKEAVNNPAAPAPKAGYSMAVRYGDWVWSAGASPTDFESRAAYSGGLGHTQPDGVWVDPNFAYDSTIMNQARYDLEKLSMYLEAADSDLQHVLKAQVYLTDCSDLPGLMQVWRGVWGDTPPATTVVPIDRMLIGGSTCEINVIAVTKSSGLAVDVIETVEAPRLPFGIPQAVKAGPYLFLSGVLAADEEGMDERARADHPLSPYLVAQGRDEMHVIVEHLEAVCTAAGGSMSDVARVQLFSTKLTEIGSALGPWNETFVEEAPTLSIIGVTGPHVVPGLTMVADVIAYMP